MFSSGFWQSFFLFEEQKLRRFHIFKGPFHPSSHPRCNFSAPPRRDSTMASIRGYGCAAVEMVRQNLDAGGRLLAEWVVLIGGCSRDTNPGARTGIDLDVLSLSLSLRFLYPRRVLRTYSQHKTSPKCSFCCRF